VTHVIVCGHYGCGGVRAAHARSSLGLIDNWLRHVQDVRDRHEAQLAVLKNDDARIDRLCELNVIDQVRNVCLTTIVQDAWRRGQDLTIHGWIYGLDNGLLRDLGCSIDADDQVASVYARVLAPG
jgi:carbonic anhydrase